MIHRNIISLPGPEFDKIDINRLFIKIFSGEKIEDSFISNWNENRKKEFLLGREIVFDLINNVGREYSNLTRLDDGRCSWPSGISGSISHTLNRQSYDFNCIGVIGTENELIGVDIESISRFENLESKIFINEIEKEMRHIDMEEKKFKSIVFSSKESIFKAIYPLYLKYFGFESALLQDLSHISNTKFISKYLLSESITKVVGYSIVEVVSNISKDLVISELVIRN